MCCRLCLRTSRPRPHPAAAPQEAALYHLRLSEPLYSYAHPSAKTNFNPTSYMCRVLKSNTHTHRYLKVCLLHVTVSFTGLLQITALHLHVILDIYTLHFQ